MMSPLFIQYINMDGVVREIKPRIEREGAKLESFLTNLFMDNPVLLAESEEKLQKVVNELYMVCKRMKLKMNTGKRKVVASERR